MERGKRTEAVDGEIHLHEAVIQHIQSFLSCKEAAQTSILSKTWYSAWATRPIVDLDQRHFQSCGGADTETLITDGFLESSKKIMLRYEESNLKIESFRIYMKNMETDCFSLVNELILDAMKLGAYALNVKLKGRKFYLPLEVLRSENLVRLSVSGCRIDLGATGGKVGFSKLKSLSLRRVIIVGFTTLDIVSNCPLIEELVLSNCISICTVPIDELPSSSSSFIYFQRRSNGNTVEMTRKLALGSLAEFENQGLGSIVDAPIRPYDKLKCLYLNSIQIDKLLFYDMSRSFPCLKDLTLKYCHGFEGLRIYSPSLEFLSLAYMTESVKFDVPSLHKFTFKGSRFPLLSFEAASREWESDITIVHMQNYIGSSWLDMLKDFLMKLSLSKISLSLCFGITTVEGFYLVGHVPNLPKPEVENLMLSMFAPTSISSLIIKRVFWTCRPKFITHGLLPEFSTVWEENGDMLKLLCKTLIDKESEGCCIPNRRMFDKYGLEKVDVEVFEDSLAEWRPLPWKALVHALKSPEKKLKTRFKLSWRQNASTH